MAAGYFEAGKVPLASFELFVRELPPSRGYLVAAGLVSAINYLENLHYTEDQVEYLRSLPALEGVAPEFFDEYLPRVRFTGDIWAVPEGAPIFATEPLIRVTAPLAEAQLGRDSLVVGHFVPDLSGEQSETGLPRLRLGGR